MNPTRQGLTFPALPFGRTWLFQKTYHFRFLTEVFYVLSVLDVIDSDGAYIAQPINNLVVYFIDAELSDDEIQRRINAFWEDYQMFLEDGAPF